MRLLYELIIFIFIPVAITHLVQAAHEIKLYHRDIQWENIIRRTDDESKWFLID